MAQVRITPDLTIHVGEVAVPLTGRQGLRLSEALARHAVRRIFAEEETARAVRQAARAASREIAEDASPANRRRPKGKSV